MYGSLQLLSAVLFGPCEFKGDVDAWARVSVRLTSETASGMRLFHVEPTALDRKVFGIPGFPNPASLPSTFELKVQMRLL